MLFDQIQTLCSLKSRLLRRMGEVVFWKDLGGACKGLVEQECTVTGCTDGQVCAEGGIVWPIFHKSAKKYLSVAMEPSTLLLKSTVQFWELTAKRVSSVPLVIVDA